MNESLKLLLALQKIDSDLIFLESVKEKRPRELEREKEKLTAAGQVVTNIEQGIKELRMACDRGELEVRNNQAEIEKFQIALNTAKSNDEYRVFSDKIDKAAEQNSAIEEKVLETMTQIDGLDEEKKGATAKEKEVLAEIKEKEAEVNAFIAEVDEKINALTATRNEAVEGIDRESLDLYDRVLARYRDSALALVENKICQGCNMSITSQHMAELRSGKDLVQCLNCVKILYLPEHGS